MNKNGPLNEVKVTKITEALNLKEEDSLKGN